ncbi:AAA family ATPase [Streptacidiphilus sp. N1-10]|uniref:AAA family ATPase n=1 Tax=Streptacidiphilus jeojiensis TaxID=3229225 RepID=A0ABV6XET9_9ACTN
MLIVVCGLPATGKTTLSRLLARDLTAVHLRIDTIEQAIVRSGTAEHPLGPVGYTVAHALAADHLRQGLTVVAECVNPLAVTRDGWQDLAAEVQVPFAEVEVVCSDPAKHRRRAAGRTVDIPGLPLPSWQEIVDRRYDAWDREHITVDTAHRTVEDCLREIRDRLSADAARRLPR